MKPIPFTSPFLLSAAAVALIGSGTVAVGQDTPFSGLVNQPLGSATLSVEPGHLRIGNIGSSGQDGVRILHPGFDGLDLEWTPFVPPQGTFVDLTTIGTLGGNPDQVLAHSSSTLAVDEVELRAEFPHAGSGLKRVEYLRDNEVVAAWDDVPSDHIATVLPSTLLAEAGSDRHSTAEDTDGDGFPDAVCLEWTFEPIWSDFAQYVTVYSPHAQAPYQDINKIRVVSAKFDSPLEPKHTDLLLKDMPDLLMSAEGVLLLGHHERGIENGRLTAIPGALAVSEIGSSGMDGVAVAFDAADSVRLDLANLPDPSTLVPGDRLVVATRGVMGGQPGSDLGKLRIVKTQGPLVIEADYSSAGATQVLVSLYSGGGLVWEGSVPMGVVLRIPVWPDSCGKRIFWWPYPLACNWSGWIQPVDVVVPGVGNFPQIDEARFLAEDSVAGVSQIDRVALLGKNLGDFEITAISSEPLMPPTVYCEAKVNSKGCLPSIGWTGKPSLSGDDFVITAENVISKQNGLMIFGYAEAAIPLQGGTLCIQPPFFRTPVQNSGGNGGDCSGTFAFHFGADLMNAKGLSIGDDVYAQYWYRDPQDSWKSGLSDGLKFTIRP